MLFNKINWLLKTNVKAKVCVIGHSRFYVIGTKATGGFITYK
jgi:hypothetical protein